MENNMVHLTVPQQNIWNLQQFYKETCISNICGSVIWQKKYSVKIIEQALNKVIELQSGLRLHFCYKEGEVVQYLSEYKYRQFIFNKFVSSDEFEKYACEFAKRSFEQINSDMFCFEIVETEGKIGVIACMSHLISDAWSFSLLVKNVTHICDCIENNADIDLAAENYLEYVESEDKYFSSARFKKAENFWKEKYSVQPKNSPIKVLPSAISVPTSKRFSTKLSSNYTSKIDKFCNDNNINQAVLFETALFTYLKRINSENHTVTIGVPVLNRAGLERNVIGMFISTMPLTVAVSEKYSALGLCEEITTAHAQLFRYQKYPYSYILSDLRRKSNFSGNLYDVMISFQNAKTDSAAKTKWYANGYSETPFVLHIDNRDNDESYTLTVDYQTEVFKQDDEVELLLNRLLFIIDQIILNPEVKVSEIDIVPKEEYQRLVFEFNDTAVEYDTEKCVHEIFTHQAKQTPDKIALVFEHEQFTYKQIDEMSNSVAHFLYNKEIKRNEVVPIVAKRSWRIIVAMIGVLKAGGTFFLVDCKYPRDRIEYLIEECRAKIVLSLDCNISNAVNFDSIPLGSNLPPLQIHNNENDNVCIIHTSGSTGKPKAATLTNKGLCNFINYTSKFFTETKQAISSTYISFDAFILETIVAICNNIQIILLSDNQITSQNEFENILNKYKKSFMFCTPTKLMSYIQNSYNGNFVKNISTFVIGGENFSEEVYSKIFFYNSNCNVYNGYGPTETTLHAADYKINSSDITIGKPIANTQIYILDKERKPLPIGVAGELCISGDGVGNGYFNRPELTAEKFIPNPFIKGKIMYCTGDLARWRADGNIEYLGRIDTQVKIRGLRIELGEIESVMNTFAGMKITAVADKRDESGRQYLVGYYTADRNIDEKALRQHLGSKLPKYMIPNYFVCLDEMPMTPSGKIDRKNLPLPDFAISSDEYTAPETEREIILCGLLSDLFNTEKISVCDNFFDIGGDSLKAIEYVSKAHNKGVDFSLQNVFDYPTVRELCEFMENGKRTTHNYTAVDFDKYDEILKRNVIDESFVPKKSSLGNVLITGTTGFLGAHILDSVMQKENGKVYCLVRSNSENDRRGKLTQLLNYYFGNKYDNEIGKRIIPIVGDITIQDLSKDIPNDIQTVIHTAATVKHYGSYEYFCSVNVEGTHNVVEYSKRVNAKMIHISTLSVSGNSLADEFEVYRSSEEKSFYESSLFIEQPLENVYVRSKFEAELKVLDAMLLGLDAKIIRVGNLTNRLSDSKFQPNYQSNAFLTRFKAALDLGLFPDYLLPLYAEFSPVDQTADGVVKIAQYADKQCIFHLNSNRPIYFDRMLEILDYLGIKMQIVSGESFNETLQKLARNSDTEYIYEAFQNDMDENGRLIYDSNIHIKNDFTDWFMRKLEFEWKIIDINYIKKYINYFKDIGYFK